MKAMLNLALVAALATVVFAREIGNNNHHREKRALPLLKGYKSGGSGAGPLPPHVDPNIGQSSAQLNSMSTSASMSGPLATMGVTLIITSAVMAANYFQAVNSQRRSYIQKRSTLDINQESTISLINSFR